MDLQNKTIMITGASRGIGAEAARAFAAAGANVALLARGKEAIEALSAEIGAKAIALPSDVASFAEVSAAVQTTVETFGGVDVLINNAGVIEPVSHLSAAQAEAWGQVIDINLKGVFYGMRAVLPVMKAAGGGSILTISSGAAHGPVEGWSHYCASKAAVNMLTRCVDKEEAAHGIRAIGLSPGTVATQMQREIKASGVNPVSKLAWEDHIPPEWVAKCLVWMCSADADRFKGDEISLREESIRRAVGLI